MRALPLLILLSVLSVKARAQITDSLSQRDSVIAEVYEQIRLRIDTIDDGLAKDFIEIDQLIINETISKLGADFQDLFYSIWQWPTDIPHSFIIIIIERPFFGNTTQIEISINDIRVYQRFLQPRYEVLEQIANEAAAFSLQYIRNYNEIIKQLNGEDMKGTGIY